MQEDLHRVITVKAPGRVFSEQVAKFGKHSVVVSEVSEAQTESLRKKACTFSFVYGTPSQLSCK